MLEIERKVYPFKTKQIWFSDFPFDVNNYDGIIFHECKNNVDIPGFHKEEFTTLVVDLTQDLDQIFNDMRPTHRKSIRKAEKEEVTIKINENYELFYELNMNFRKEKKLPPYNVDINYMKKYGTLFTAEIEGEIVDGSLVLEDSKNIRGLISASKRLESKEKMALIANTNKLLHWEKMKYAKNRGIIEYDLGGYYTGNVKDEEKERINFFKKGFGGKVVMHYIYQKDYSKTYQLARNLHESIQKLKYMLPRI